MAIGLFEKFTGFNWERVSNYTGPLASVMCVFFGIMTWVFGFNVGIGFCK
jgi:hypothetical protein